MKKLGTLAVLLSLGLFSVGCQKADTGAGAGDGNGDGAPAATQDEGSSDQAAPAEGGAPADQAAPAEGGSGETK